MQNGRFPSRTTFHLKKVCCKLSLCENCQRQSCKAFIGLYSHVKIVGGVIPLNVNFVLGEPPTDAATMRITTFTKFDEYSICIAMIRTHYEITNNVH